MGLHERFKEGDRVVVIGLDDTELAHSLGPGMENLLGVEGVVVASRENNILVRHYEDDSARSQVWHWHPNDLILVDDENDI